MSFKKGKKIMLIGYARVFSEDQVLDLQVDALKMADSKIFSDNVSGAWIKKPTKAVRKKKRTTNHINF